MQALKSQLLGAFFIFAALPGIQTAVIPNATPHSHALATNVCFGICKRRHFCFYMRGN